MLWMLLVGLGLIKLTIASLMVWLPVHYDTAMVAIDDPPRGEDAQPGPDDEGGSKVREPHPRRPLPRLPRRGGPHGSPSPGVRPRVRIAARAGTRRSTVSN